VPRRGRASWTFALRKNWVTRAAWWAQIRARKEKFRPRPEVTCLRTGGLADRSPGPISTRTIRIFSRTTAQTLRPNANIASDDRGIVPVIAPDHGLSPFARPPPGLGHPWALNDSDGRKRLAAAGTVDRYWIVAPVLDGRAESRGLSNASRARPVTFQKKKIVLE